MTEDIKIRCIEHDPYSKYLRDFTHEDDPHIKAVRAYAKQIVKGKLEMNSITTRGIEILFCKAELKILEDILIFINDSLLNFYKGDLAEPTFYSVHDIKSYTKEKIAICKDNISASESMLQNNHIQKALRDENS